MAKVSVIGAGAWGTTLSILLAENKHEVSLWTYEKEVFHDIRDYQENKKYLTGFPLSALITPATDLNEAVAGKELVIISVPTQFLSRFTLRSVKAPILSASKGIDEETLKLPHEIIGADAVISGPNLAKEIAAGKPAATVVASKDSALAKKIQKLLSSDKFRVYTNDDVVGVELGGALKNIIAIAAGAADGFGLGDNAKSALLIRGIAEITRLGVSLGANAQTFSGLSGMGDLITTCSSNLSRNHHVGYELAKGKKLPDILASMKDVAEGVPTCRAAVKLAKKQNIEMPITNETYEVLFKGKDPFKAITSLMTRTHTSE
ncbi:MAG: NAD(P)H-dependent glycerol-3-phosphate dehydrogenase [Candidatus Margulisiibacteriota bacterium]